MGESCESGRVNKCIWSCAVDSGLDGGEEGITGLVWMEYEKIMESMRSSYSVGNEVGMKCGWRNIWKKAMMRLELAAHGKRVGILM